MAIGSSAKSSLGYASGTALQAAHHAQQEWIILLAAELALLLQQTNEVEGWPLRLY
jgi:hypothetical protein